MKKLFRKLSNTLREKNPIETHLPKSIAEDQDYACVSKNSLKLYILSLRRKILNFAGDMIVTADRYVKKSINQEVKIIQHIKRDKIVGLRHQFQND